MEVRIARIAYAIEFFTALIAVFSAWSQVGGQGHLDLLDWYWKLILSVALSLAVVKATAAAACGDRFLNARTVLWLTLSLLLTITMGIVTYYVHLHEPQDEQDEPALTVTSTRIAAGRASR